MSKEKLLQLEYRDDQKYERLNAVRKQIKEVPYMQNNPSQQKVTATANNSEEETKR